MNLVISLPKTWQGNDAVFAMMDQFSKLVTFILCVTSYIAADIVQLFFDYAMCKFGMPKKIISY